MIPTCDWCEQMFGTVRGKSKVCLTCTFKPAVKEAKTPEGEPKT